MSGWTDAAAAEDSPPAAALRARPSRRFLKSFRPRCLRVPSALTARIAPASSRRGAALPAPECRPLTMVCHRLSLRRAAPPRRVREQVAAPMPLQPASHRPPSGPPRARPQHALLVALAAMLPVHRRRTGRDRRRSAGRSCSVDQSEHSCVACQRTWRGSPRGAGPIHHRPPRDARAPLPTRIACVVRRRSVPVLLALALQPPPPPPLLAPAAPPPQQQRSWPSSPSGAPRWVAGSARPGGGKGGLRSKYRSIHRRGSRGGWLILGTSYI